MHPIREKTPLHKVALRIWWVRFVSTNIDRSAVPSAAIYRRRRRLLTRVALGIAMIMIIVGSPALGSGPGESAARRYAAASEMTLRAMSQRVPESEATIRRLVTGMRMRCPGVVAHAPSNQQSKVLRQEIAIAIVLAFVAPDRSYIRRFIATIGRISWGSTRIAALVGNSNAEGTRLIAVPSQTSATI
jgi:hypothetical protein